MEGRPNLSPTPWPGASIRSPRTTSIQDEITVAACIHSRIMTNLSYETGLAARGDGAVSLGTAGDFTSFSYLRSALVPSTPVTPKSPGGGPRVPPLL